MFVIWRHRRENPVLFPITLGFSILSVGFGNWIGRIPETKRLLGLSESDLGLCFFGMATGAFLGAQIAATLCEKWKPAIVISVSCWLLCLGIILIPFANSQLSLTSILFFMGTANSWLNVSMNAAASQMENKLKTPILSTCHGMYSLGGVVGITSRTTRGSIIQGADAHTSDHIIIRTIRSSRNTITSRCRSQSNLNRCGSARITTAGHITTIESTG